MKQLVSIIGFTFVLQSIQAQPFSYKDSLMHYQFQYVNKHEVVTGEMKQYIDFFPVEEKYRVTADFSKINQPKWVQFETSANTKKTYIEYGKFTFTLNDTLVELTAYQPESLLSNPDYKNYLFIPFTDYTTGEESYEVGRYLELIIDDITNNKAVLDFNKAYNPYCAYVSGKYSCPIPPRENHLSVAIFAGEKKFKK